nr:immunoglobulin light chain junction region [Macaca mulatta]
CQQNSDWPLTF